MQENFTQLTTWVLRHEGGYVNHPKDPGGATNYGVTQRVYDAFRSRVGAQQQSVRNISMTEVYAIYKQQYWDKIWGDELPAGVDYALYDFAINSGPSRAVKFIQELVHVKVDGMMGNVTIAAIRGCNDVLDLIERLCNKRWAWLKTLRMYSTFGKGWTRRVMGKKIGSQEDDDGVIDRASVLAMDSTKIDRISAPKKIDDGAGEKSEDADVKTSERLKESINVENLGKVAGGVVPGAIGAASALPEGPLQYAAAGIAVLFACLAAFIVYKKLIK